MKFCAIDMKTWRRNISASLAVMLIAVSSFAKETWHYDDLELFIKGSTIMAAGGGDSQLLPSNSYASTSARPVPSCSTTWLTFVAARILPPRR